MRLIASIAMLFMLLVATTALSQERPNILVIWGDDIQIDGDSGDQLAAIARSTSVRATLRAVAAA
jgi:hypothetical protein